MADEKQQQQMPQYPQQYPRRRSSNWWVPVLIIGIVIVLVVVLFFAFISAITSSFEPEEVEVKKNSVLYLDLSGGVQEYVESSPFNLPMFGGSSAVSHFRLLSAIEAAKTDDNIKGIFYKSNLESVGFSKTQDIIDKLQEFKESGKFIYSYIDFGSESQYIRALPSDSIFMPQEGMLEMNGYGVATLFMEELFNKIGINFYVVGFEDFKSAADQLSRRQFSDSAEYQLRVLIEQRLATLEDNTGEFRNMKPADFQAAISRGLYSADTLMKYGFIDAIAQEADVKEMMRKKIYGDDPKDDEKLTMISVRKYIESGPKLPGTVADQDKQIAIIYGVGPIQDRAEGGFGSDPYVITTDKMVKYIKEAREDDKVKLIILRVDSPGGSVVASDAIYNEILKTTKIKPVYASMSDVAASGGYYISMGCDTIIANPSTITGSIGVIAAIPNVSEMMSNIYLHPDTISTSPHAQFMNGMYPYTEQDKERFYNLIAPVYHRFVSKVAEHRGMDYEHARSLAKGRVWTGTDAKERGLVDVLGGMDKTISLAKKRIGLDDTMRVAIKIWPKPVDEITAILRMFGLDDSEMSISEREKIAENMGVKPNLLESLVEEMPEVQQESFKYMLQLREMSMKEKALVALPYHIYIK